MFNFSLITTHRPRWTSTRRDFATQSNINRTERAFCRAQNCPPDDSTVCVIVMRSDASMNPDEELHAMMYEDCSLNVADINL